MKRIEILALLSLSLSSCSEYFDKQQSKNELKKKDCPLFESYRDSINKYTILSNELDY